MAVFRLNGIRDDSDLRSDYPRTGRIVVQSGTRRQHSAFVVRQARADSANGTIIHSAAEFEFSGDLIVEAFEGERSVAAFTISDSFTGSSEHRVEGWGSAYTLRYSVLPSTARNTGIDSPLERIMACDAHPLATDIPVARNTWNCAAPPEVGLVFVPQHNRRILKYAGPHAGGDNGRPVNDAALRDAYRARVEATGNWGGVHAFVRRGDAWVAPTPTDDAAHAGVVRLHVPERRDQEYFAGGAARFAAYWGRDRSVRVCVIDNGFDRDKALGGRHFLEGREGVVHTGQGDSASRADRLKRVIESITAYDGPALSAIAFCCHGWASGWQLGPDGPRSAESLVTALRGKMRQDLVFILYACSCATGANGGVQSIAAQIRDLLVREGAKYCRVVGHTGAGDAFRLPHVRFFEGRDGVGASGIDVAPISGTDRSLNNRFRQELSLHGSNFPWVFPFMSVDAIHAYLRSPSRRPAQAHRRARGGRHRGAPVPAAAP